MMSNLTQEEKSLSGYIVIISILIVVIGCQYVRFIRLKEQTEKQKQVISLLIGQVVKIREIGHNPTNLYDDRTKSSESP